MLGTSEEGKDLLQGGWYRFEKGSRRGDTYDLEIKVCAHPLCCCTGMDLVCSPRETAGLETSEKRYVRLDAINREASSRDDEDPASESLARALAQDLSDDDWESLGKTFLRAKRHHARKADLASLDTADFPYEEVECEGLLIAYRQIVPFDERLGVTVGPGKPQLFEVDDLYCVRHECDCRDVLLVFEATPRDPSVAPEDVPATCVVLDVGSGRWRVEEEEGDLGVDSARLMKTFLAESRPRALLAERRRILRSMYRNSRRRAGWLKAPRVAERKVGRNEPCPCGSGKKYKKCCLPRAGSVAEIPRRSYY